MTAPAVVISNQEELKVLFERGELDRDCVVVARFQGPAANGMPELHQLMPILGVLQDRGHAVALVTDGRLSGASGKVPAAIHVTPEAAKGGPIGRIQDGDVISLDVASGELFVSLDDQRLGDRPHPDTPTAKNTVGRGLFKFSREVVTDAESGGCTLFEPLVMDDFLRQNSPAMSPSNTVPANQHQTGVHFICWQILAAPMLDLLLSNLTTRCRNRLPIMRSRTFRPLTEC